LDDELRRLFEEAVASMKNATASLARNPQPGTLEWEQWQTLCARAMAANAAYVERFREVRPPDKFGNW
jgi:hypothetical protein